MYMYMYMYMYIYVQYIVIHITEQYIWSQICMDIIKMNYIMHYIRATQEKSILKFANI